MDNCAICRSPLDETCHECQHAGEPRACQGQTKNAACAHHFHVECINRWLATRKSCPLCNSTWISPWGLTLAQLAVVKFVDDEEKIVELAGMELPDKIYETLDSAGLRTWETRKRMPHTKKRLLAHVFAQYLEVDELESLIATKKRKNNKAIV